MVLLKTMSHLLAFHYQVNLIKQCACNLLYSTVLVLNTIDCLQYIVVEYILQMTARWIPPNTHNI